MKMRERVAALEQRQHDDEPLPAHVVLVRLGDTPEQARKRAGVPDDAPLVICMIEEDMSVPRPLVAP